MQLITRFADGFARYRYLGIVLITYTVMALSNVLFESVSVESLSTLDKILDSSPEKASPVIDHSVYLHELYARYFWLASALLNICIPIYVVVASCILISRCHCGRELRRVFVLMLLLAATNLWILGMNAEQTTALYRLVYATTTYALAHSNQFKPGFLQSVDCLITVVNILAFIAPPVVALAFSSTIACGQNGAGLDLHTLPTRMRHLKSCLNLAAALLVIGIFHMNAWLQWPVALVKNQTLHTDYSRTALAISMYWGTTFTLMLFLTYGPCAYTLSQRARALIPRQTADNFEETEKWLKSHGLSFNPGDQFPRYFLILSPLLAGPLQFFLMTRQGG